MTIINTALTAMLAVLQAAPAVSASIGRVRLRPVAAATNGAVVLRPLDSEVTQAAIQSGHPVTWKTRVGIECYARAVANQAPDVAVDALLASVYARLMQDPTLGGAVIQLQPQGVSFDFDAEDQAMVCATLIFLVYHRAAAGAL